LHKTRNVTKGGRGHNSRAPNHCGGQKFTTMSQALFSKQYICYRKTSGSNMGAPNLFLALLAI